MIINVKDGVNDLDQQGKHLHLIYQNERGEVFEQPVSDITDVGTLIDPDTGGDMPIVGFTFAQ